MIFCVRVSSVTEFVALPDNGVNEFLVEWVVNLAAELADIDIHDVSRCVEIAVPYVAQQVATRKHLAVVQHQVVQQAIFFDAEVNVLSVARGAMGNEVEMQVAVCA